MSWADTCGNCGDHRADCECGNWSIVRTIKPETVEKREEQKKETWIKNVMRIEGFTREIAEATYNKIFNDKKGEDS